MVVWVCSLGIWCCDCLIVRVTLSVSSALPYPKNVVYRIVPAAVLSILF